MFRSIIQQGFLLLSKVLAFFCGLMVILYFLNRLLKTNLGASVSPLSVLFSPIGAWIGSIGSFFGPQSNNFLYAPEHWQDLVLYVFMIGGSSLVSYLIYKTMENLDWLRSHPVKGLFVVLIITGCLIFVSWEIISYGNSLASKNTGGKLLEGIANKVDDATLITLVGSIEAPQTSMSFYAFDSAARAGNLSAIKILAAHGFNINAQTRQIYKGAAYDETVLMFAARSYSPEAVMALLENGAKPNLRDSLGNTALHYCLEGLIDESGVEKIRILLKAGANANIVNNDDKTPKDIVKSNFIYYQGSPEYYKEVNRIFGL